PSPLPLPLHSYTHHRALHSFPTRRSSDLESLDDLPVLPLREEATDARRHLGADVAHLRQLLGGGIHDALERPEVLGEGLGGALRDRKSTRLNSSHVSISYAVFCLKKKKSP